MAQSSNAVMAKQLKGIKTMCVLKSQRSCFWGLLVILQLLTIGDCLAQNNLVPNPSFETISSCPTGNWQLNLAPPWFSASSTISPDLYDTCNKGAVNVPNGIFGQKYANTGAAFAGIYVYGGYNFREYLEVKLDSTLQAGHTYCLSFFVSLPDSFSLGIQNFGAYFSADSTLESSDAPLSATVSPQLLTQATDFTNQKLYWLGVNGQFTATGNEQFMTIGNFFKDRNTPIDSASGGSYFYAGYSYFYIDDVQLIDCQASSGIAAIYNPLGIQVGPVPANDKLNIQFSKQDLYQVELLTQTAQVVKEMKTGDLSAKLIVNDLAKGFYILKITALANGQIYTKKVIVN